MQLTIDRSVILPALANFRSIISKTNTIPVLSNIKIEAEDGFVRLSGTDMELALSTKVEAKVREAGSITVPFGTLHEIARQMPSGAEIKIDTKEADKVKVASGRSSYSLAGISADSYPALKDDGDGVSFSLPAANLKHLLAKTLFCADTNEVTFYLTGVLLHHSKEGGKSYCRAAATNKHKLASVKMEIDSQIQPWQDAIIPPKTCSQVAKMLESTDEEVKITVNASNISFSYGDTVLLSRLIDASYPPYQRVIPMENKKKVMVSRHDFLRAVERTVLVCDENRRGANLNVSKNGIRIEASNTSGGSAEDECEAAYDGEDFAVCFNHKYLIDVLSHIDEDEMVVEFGEDQGAALWHGKGNQDCLFVIMPMLY